LYDDHVSTLFVCALSDKITDFDDEDDYPAEYQLAGEEQVQFWCAK